MEKELYHHGIKGMRWGVRRYQNSDGTLTNAGKKRYAQDAANNNWEIGSDGVARSTGKKSKGEVHKANPDKWVTEDVTRSKGVVDASSNMVNTLKNAKATADKRVKKPDRLDLSSMTDQELRNQINRELLERQYNDVFNTPKESKGREYAGRLLEDAGTVLAITSSALGIALAIRQLRGKG